ncbi:MAG: hypothetical protein FJZ63_04395 [Chlamydiae bacterium]|nr:hypothetical protein [Chlamydiota bacterium]
MKKFSWPLGLFAILLLSGGFYGFVKAHSTLSLAVSSCFGILFLVCSYGVHKEKIQALYVAAGSICSLNLFFLYRFLKTFKFMPAGLFVILTTLLGIPLFSYLTNRIKEKSTIY